MKKCSTFLFIICVKQIQSPTILSAIFHCALRYIICSFSCEVEVILCTLCLSCICTYVSCKCPSFHMDGYWLVSMESINVQLVKSQSQASSALLFEEKQLSGQSEVSVKPPNLSASKKNDGGNRILTDQRESIWQARGMEYSVLKNKSVLGSPSRNVLEGLPWLHCHLVPYNEDHQIIKDKLNWIALWPMRSNRARLFHKYERNRFCRIYASFLMSSFAEVMSGRILIATIAVIWRKGLSSNWVTWERGDESSHIFLLVIALFWNLVLDDKVWRMIKIIIIISPVHIDKSLRKLMNWE